MAKAKAPGRPSLLTSDLADEICKAVANGLPIELAAELNGISRHTVYEWVRRGEGRDTERAAEQAADSLYVEFANRYRKARAGFARNLMQPCIEAIAGKRPSKAKDPLTGKPKMVKALGAPVRANEAHWHLSRRFPEFWGQGREQLIDGEVSPEAETEKSTRPTITITYAAPKAKPAEPETSE